MGPDCRAVESQLCCAAVSSRAGAPASPPRGLHPGFPPPPSHPLLHCCRHREMTEVTLGSVADDGGALMVVVTGWSGGGHRRVLGPGLRTCKVGVPCGSGGSHPPPLPNSKAGPGGFSLNPSEALMALGALPMPDPHTGPFGDSGGVPMAAAVEERPQEAAPCARTSPLFSECEEPIKQLEPHVALLPSRRAGVCAPSSVISAEIRVPLAAVGGDRRPHKPGSPAGQEGEKAKGAAGSTPPCSRESLQLEF